MTGTTLLLMIAGLAALVGGGEVLVRGASAVARLARVTPLLIGLTVVAFGTSSPEFAVTLQGALRGEAGVALGNVLGSNVFNVLVVLGLSALIAPLTVTRQVVRLDVPVMIAASAGVWLAALDGRLSQLEGGVLVALLIAFLLFQIRRGKHVDTEADKPAPAGMGLLPALLLAAGGLALLAFGSRWLVGGALAAAHALGVPPLVAGLTVVAVGTSLPELAASAVASARGERDMAVGNAVGSNVFNLLGVLGAAALLTGGGLEVARSALTFDMPVMVGAALICLPVFLTGGRISRLEGGLMLAWYLLYMTLVVLAATGSPALRGFMVAVWVFALPMTLLGVGASVVAAARKGRAQPGEKGL
jgi:cation:H+ antiporter